MPTSRPWGFYLRILLAVILIAVLNLAPRPHAVRQALNQARQALQRNDIALATNRIKQAAEQFPLRTELHLLAARHALQSGKPDDAIQILEQPRVVSRLDPSDMLVLGDAYQQRGESHMAAAIWQRIAEIAPSPEVFQRLADYHQSRSNYPAAIEDLSQLLQFKPTDAEVNYRLGLLYSVVDPEASLPYLSQAAEFDPTLSPAAEGVIRKIRTATLFDEPAYTFTAVGRALAMLDEWNLAEAAFSQATQVRPDYAEAWAFLGEARQHATTIMSENYPALADLQQAQKLDATSVSVNLLLGLYWSRHGEYQTASRYIQNAITQEPENPLLYAELANALAHLGDLPAAQSAYQYAISLAPTDPLFYRLLVEFSLSNRIQIRELALPAARSAVILSPQDPRSLDILGQTFLALGDFLNAQRTLLEALENDPFFAPAHLHLGMIYVQSGDLERGRSEFDLAESYGSGTRIETEAQRYIHYFFP